MGGVTLVTGATGFIGSHALRGLAERGDRLRATQRAGSHTDHVADVDCEWVRADLGDRRALRRALTGVERVFHVAGSSNLRAAPAEAFRVHVAGTRTLLEECLRAEVERVVHVSSVAAIGPAKRGSTADETQLFRAGHLGIPYVNAKHEGETEALRLAARGLPVTIACPAFVLGPGDPGGSSSELVRRFLLRQIPAVTDGALNVVDVRDVARGLLAVDAHGRVGERYILGNRNYTWDRLFADLARESGVEPPAVRLPRLVAGSLAYAASGVPGRPHALPLELRALTQYWTYRSTKARRELGFSATIPHEETVAETVAWHRERDPERLGRGGTAQPLPLKLTGLALRTLSEGTARLVGR